MTLWRSRETGRGWYAICDARLLRWNGVSSHDRCAVLGGQLVAAQTQTKPPYWVWNHALHQLYMSSYHLSPAKVPHYMHALREHDVAYIEGYPSALHALAVEVLATGVEAPRIKVVVTNAEPLFEHQKRAIERAFGCPVRDTYGMTETVVAASRCEEGGLHLWPEVGVLEVVSDTTGEAVEADRSGALLGTGLLGHEMPLVRYEVGTRPGGAGDGALRLRWGLPPPEVEGRLTTGIVTPDGRHRAPRSGAQSHPPIREAQIDGNPEARQDPARPGRRSRKSTAGSSSIDPRARGRSRDRRGPRGRDPQTATVFRSVISLVNR